MRGLRVPPEIEPSSRRVAVRVTADAERQIRGGHPWLYERSITSSSHDGAAGDLAVIFDRRRNFVAIGLWDPSSPIRVRILHRGDPTPIDEHWFRSTLLQSFAHRAPLAEAGHTDAYRLVHGENDGLPGLVLDRYGDALVVKIYTAAWFPWLQPVLTLVHEVLRPRRMVLRWARRVETFQPAGWHDGTELLPDAPPDPQEFVEHDLVFGADLRQGHKTGHFLDQRDNRQRVARVARDQSVLDVFSCTGGFALHAAAHGARSVRLIDQSAPALAEARANVARNPALAATEFTTTVGDAFAVLDQLVATGSRFGVVVVDPPSFASRRRDASSAERAYRTLTSRAARLVEPGGYLMQASCSTQVTPEQLDQAVDRGLSDAGRSAVEADRFGHPLDHPIGFAQGRYLASVLLRLDQVVSDS